MFRDYEKVLRLEPNVHKQKPRGLVEKGSMNYSKETPTL